MSHWDQIPKEKLRERRKCEGMLSSTGCGLWWKWGQPNAGAGATLQMGESRHVCYESRGLGHTTEMVTVLAPGHRRPMMTWFPTLHGL